MDRSVACQLEAEVEGTSDVTLSVAVAADAARAAESLVVTLDGAPVDDLLLDAVCS